jgi:CheY-like chemotaxis protein
MRKIRILIIEDDPDIVDLLASVLGDGYECYAASNGLEGLQLAHRGEPDLIVCDIMMPVLDGWEFVRRLRKYAGFEQTPVIFLTALSAREKIREGYRLGVGLYLTKPIDPPRLKRNIELFVEDHSVASRPKRLTIEDVLVGEDDSSIWKHRQGTGETTVGRKETTAETGALGTAPGDTQSRRREEDSQSRMRNEDTQSRRRKEETTTQRRAREEDTQSRARQAAGQGMDGDEETTTQRRARQAAGAAGSAADPNEQTQSRLKKHAGQPRTVFKWRPADILQQKASDKVRVQVVDDDADTQQMIRTGLPGTMEVIESHDGIAAIEMAARYKPDILVIDGVLPKMTGYQLTMMLRKNKEFVRTPIIFISGRSSPRDQQYAQKMGANHFLSKPFKIKALQEIIERIVKQEGFAIRTDRPGMGQAHLEQLQHRETHRSDPLPSVDEIERRHLENTIRKQMS